MKKIVLLAAAFLSFSALADLVTIRPGQSVTLTRPGGQLTQVTCLGGPTPVPTPYPGSPEYYLSLPDDTLFYYATTSGVGVCNLSQGGPGAACVYYVKANGYGYPSGSGCTSYAGDGTHSRANALNILRQAIRTRVCL